MSQDHHSCIWLLFWQDACWTRTESGAPDPHGGGRYQHPAFRFSKPGRPCRGHMQRTFRDAITVLKFDFLEMKCLLQMQLPRVQSEADESSLPSRDTSPHSPQSSHSQAGQGLPAMTEGRWRAFISTCSIPTKYRSQCRGWNDPSISSFNFQTDTYQHNRFTSTDISPWHRKLRKSSTMLQEAARAPLSALPTTPCKRSALLQAGCGRRWLALPLTSHWEPISFWIPTRPFGDPDKPSVQCVASVCTMGHFYEVKYLSVSDETFWQQVILGESRSLSRNHIFNSKQPLFLS